MKIAVAESRKLLGALVEYLDAGKLRPGLVVRESEKELTLLDARGRQAQVARELVLVHHPGRKTGPEDLAATVAALEEERARLSAELDLNLLWEVVHEQGRAFSASELAELFFGNRSAAATSVMLEALLADRLYFVRRHMEFIPREAAQVARLRQQEERLRLKSDSAKRTRELLRAVIADGFVPPAEETGALVSELARYLENPFTRSSELTAMLAQVAPEVPPPAVAYEVLERLGAAPAGPRFAVIGGVKLEHDAEALSEALAPHNVPRPPLDDPLSMTIDDEETLEVDDALSAEPLPGDRLRVRIHIALVADHVEKGSAMDREAAARAVTVYLPEVTARMLPEAVSCDRASLKAGEERSVLTTEVELNPDGGIARSSIYPTRVRVGARLNYAEADRILAGERAADPALAATLGRLHAMALRLRERRRSAGAVLTQRREPKVRVRGDLIEVQVIDPGSPGRTLVAEFMVLSNHVAARYAVEHGVPIIYRVQPLAGGDLAGQRPRLSLYPEFHAGVGLDCYAQLSSPIRRYSDLVLQRQILGALSEPRAEAYRVEELLSVLGGTEAADAEAKELERRARRYWVLRYLERNTAGRLLAGTVQRDGLSVELDGYAVRGSLHGAPNLPTNTRILVQVSKIDLLRGWLALDYVSAASLGAERAV